MCEFNELISIITPVFNSELYLEETIISVIKQSYTNWELILIDDGSTDNSFNIMKVMKKVTHPQTHKHRPPVSVM